MLRVPKGCATAALIATCLGASSVANASVSLIFFGTLTSGFDSTGVFGAAGQDLTGASASVAFNLSDVSYFQAFPDPPNTFQGYYWNTVFGTISATVTVNGNAAGVSPQWWGNDSFADWNDHSVSAHITNFPDAGFFSQSSISASFTSPDDLLTDQRYVSTNEVVAADGVADASFVIRDSFIPEGPNDPPAYDVRYALGNLKVNAIIFNVTDRLAVPEPTSWALMIAGFSLAGSGLRRRRAAAG